MKPTLLETHALKDEGGTRDWLVGEHKGKQTSPTEPQSNNLELRLGISLNASASTSNKQVYKDHSNMISPSTRLLSTLEHHGLVLNGLGPSSSGPKSWVPPELGCSGFIHPWSLAARQQKAVLEQAHQRANGACSTLAVSRLTPPTPPPIVGWPPVRASRRNLSGLNPIKPEMEDEKDAKKAKIEENGEERVISSNDQVKPTTMFVKVNMEGFAVGRKINLKAHNSYESLSRALQKMFANFLSKREVDNSSDYILLYEDNEGDRMLVGDVPWELFITSVKRLYIAHSPETPKKDDEKVTDDQK
ncbi:auxin-responsive protein IAA25-like isoform X2 [Asparagus officinalis]|uniref:auxin-responsive protein IAA25-like isoform X2 n=1 Tax=Asparagus officinalis TaxID=4686 RepID=UPI00098DFA1E|nr:auxin-responsive protein IAA25-like isoform X2 [Asparagus officinalis]